jgi:double-stranded uracil-DNA glycosylase
MAHREGPSQAPWRPTKGQLEAAVDQTIPDVLGTGLDVVFCGINPGLYSGAVGHHFARPGNRFWPALHQSGFTERLYSPFEDTLLLNDKVGITNLVSRTTARALDLSPGELRVGGQQLSRKVRRFGPRKIAVLGIGAFKLAFGRTAPLGRQEEAFEGAELWVLPNPSGLQARYQLPDLVERFRELREGRTSRKS